MVIDVGSQEEECQTDTVSIDRDELERLRRRCQQLTDAHAQLSQFSRLVAHELCEPLRAIHGFAELLVAGRTGALSDEGQELARTIVSSAERMRDLVGDLLARARTMALAKETGLVELNSVVASAIEDLRPVIRARGATIKTATLPTVLGNGASLRHVFRNLIGNSLKFHGAAAPCIEITCQSSGEEYTIAVRDHGIGIPSRFHESIFEPFRRLHCHDEYPGSGLGLSLCRQIVEACGGRIWAELPDGQGVVFMFTLRGVDAS